MAILENHQRADGSVRVPGRWCHSWAPKCWSPHGDRSGAHGRLRRPVGSGDAMPTLAFHGGEVECQREGEAGEQAGDNEEPGPAQASAVAIDNRKDRQQNNIGDRVVLAG